MVSSNLAVDRVGLVDVQAFGGLLETLADGHDG
jgi:hypothetical protein